MTVPISNLTDLWNNAGTSFTAVQMNVTNTSSAAGSKLLDLQVGSSSKASVDPTGVLTCNTIVGSSVTPAVLGVTSSFNDYYPGSRAYFIRLTTPVGSSVITGMNTSSQVDGEQHLILNVSTGAANITFAHQSTSSVATNRFQCDPQSDFNVPAGFSASATYDATLGRWYLHKN